LHKLFGFSEQLSSKDSDSGGSISNFFVLGLGNIDEDFSCGVVDEDG